MAHMYPGSLEGVDIRSPAEARLFEAFRDQLSDYFYVFYSVAWLGIRHPGAPPADGEADFVIVHPAMGILVIEVKGGRVGIDPDTGWYSVRADGTRIDIKDPVEQAKRNKHALIDKIRSLPNWPGAYPTVGHAIAFPDGTIDLPDMGPAIPPEIVVMHEHLARVEEWVRTCMKFWAGDRFVAPGESGVLTIRDLLRKSWLLREPLLGEEIGPEASAIKRYTEEQFQILDILASRPRAAIRGCAGSGKTMLAIEKARRLAKEGFHTLLTCYNRNLAKELQRMTGVLPRLKIQNFHALCQEYASRIGWDQRPDWNDARADFFTAVMPEALVEAAMTGMDGLRFDAIVADEGQDFEDTWWVALQMLLRDPDNGILYVFYDDNQLVYRRSLALPVSDMPFALTRNCRNTRQIHNVVTKFYLSDLKLSARGPDGRPPDINFFRKNPAELRAALTEILARLVYVERIRPEDIVILSSRGLEGPPLQDMASPGAFSLASDYPAGGPQICCTKIRLFKGLESPVLILIVTPDLDALDELMYVGTSRARHHLEILLEEDVQESLPAKLMAQVR